MSDVATVVCWPACTDAIQWSSDGIVALASDERVELLFPHTKSNDTDQDFSSWHHIPLPASWFTAEELPAKDIASGSTYSVGEELSPSAPICIAWSPPGIAKHRRCALGVLTSSLVLSVWASEGKADDEASWKRKLIINDALLEYFSSNVDEVGSSLVSDTVEKMRLRTRVRCFAWSPSLYESDSSAVIGLQRTWGQPIVAVANDDNHIAFVALDTPTTTLGTEDVWSGEVLNHFSIDSESIVSNPTTFDEIMQQQRHVSSIAWSPWTIQGDWYHSVLVYATNDDVRARIITYRGETIGTGNDEIVYPDIQLRYAGRMKWSTKVEDWNKLTLALFTLSDVVVLTISASDASILSRASFPLDGRWAEMSAAVWDHTSTTSSIHFSSLQDTLKHDTGLGLSKDSKALTVTEKPHWVAQLVEAQALFNVQHELNKNVRTKIWGLATSPLGDFIASCSTVHPSDMIEYGSAKDRRTSVAVTGFRPFSPNGKLHIPSGTFSAEGLVFTLRKWLESTGDGNESSPDVIQQMTEHIFESHWRPETRDLGDYAVPGSSEEFKGLVDTVREDVMLNEYTIQDRVHILVSQVCAPSAETDLQRSSIAYRLASIILATVPRVLATVTPFSTEIRTHHRHVIALIEAVMAEDDAAPQQAVVAKPCDTCEICHAGIPLTDLTTATCLNGHEFPRCGLSFLAIQAPRISKWCGLCKTPFLNDVFVRLQETKDLGGEVVQSVEDEDASMADRGGPVRDDGENLPVSLARVLFLACDVCIYCGGKFTG